MYDSVIDRLTQLCGQGDKLTGDRRFSLRASRVSAFLKVAVGPNEADYFVRTYAADDWAQHTLRIDHLQGPISKIESREPRLLSVITQVSDMSGNAGRTHRSKLRNHRYLAPLQGNS
jgi:hypothetical protein